MTHAYIQNDPGRFVMDHKIPQGAFRSLHTESRHYSSYESLWFRQDIWKEGRRDRKYGKWLLCFIRLPRQNYISFEQFDSMAGCCGAQSTGDRKANEQIVGFAWLARRLNGSCKLMSVWGMVISSYDLLLAFKVELLSQPLSTEMDPIQDSA